MARKPKQAPNSGIVQSITIGLVTYPINALYPVSGVKFKQGDTITVNVDLHGVVTPAVSFSARIV
jgi:hypothetical protein